METTYFKITKELNGRVTDYCKREGLVKEKFVAKVLEAAIQKGGKK